MIDGGYGLDRPDLELRHVTPFSALVRGYLEVVGPEDVGALKDESAIAGGLSALRRRRGGFPLRYLSPHCRKPTSAMPRSRPLAVSRYS
jgi:hypothetical protein